MESELIRSIYDLINSGIVRLLISVFIIMAVNNILKYWSMRFFYIWRLNSMNVIAEDRWIQIDDVIGSATRIGDTIKITGKDLRTERKVIAFYPLKQIIEEKTIKVPIVGEKETL